jgi:hypothetical protein
MSTKRFHALLLAPPGRSEGERMLHQSATEWTVSRWMSAAGEDPFAGESFDVVLVEASAVEQLPTAGCRHRMQQAGLPWILLAPSTAGHLVARAFKMGACDCVFYDSGRIAELDAGLLAAMGLKGRSGGDPVSGDAARLEVLTGVARVIAHNYNNVLSGISGNISLLQMVMPEAEKGAKYFDRMMKAIGQLTDLSARLSAYAKNRFHPRTLVEPSELLERFMPRLRQLATVTANLQAIQDGEHRFRADEMLLEFAFKRIVSRLGEQEGADDEVDIRVTARTLSPDQLPEGLPPGEFVRFSFGRAGTGKEVLQNLLPVVDHIVHQHGGFVTTALDGHAEGCLAIHFPEAGGGGRRGGAR